MKPDSDPYFQSLPIWPNFSLPNNETDDLLPSCRVESWQQFIEVMQDQQHNKANTEMVYRGHRRYDWQLVKFVLYRQGVDPLDASRREDYMNWMQEKLELFSRVFRPRIRDLEPVAE